MTWILTALGLYLLLVVILFVMQRQMLYFPPKEQPDPAASGIADLRAVTIGTADGLDLTHWYRPPAASDGSVVVLFHGNAGHIGNRADKFRELFDAGFGVLLVEYRGYGGNPGSPSEDGFTEDGRSAVLWLFDQSVAPERILLYGESLGTALAVKLAAAQARSGQPFAGVILEAPFTSIADVAQHHYWYVPARWLIRDPWRAADDIADIAAPLLAIHGRRDNTVPFKFGERLFELARDPKESLFLPGGDHNGLLDDPAVMRRIVEFLRAAS